MFLAHNTLSGIIALDITADGRKLQVPQVCTKLRRDRLLFPLRLPFKGPWDNVSFLQNTEVLRLEMKCLQPLCFQSLLLL